MQVPKDTLALKKSYSFRETIIFIFLDLYLIFKRDFIMEDNLLK